MTCEVAVMNKRGIALAADSAVTLGNGKKIYHTAEKLFSLSPSLPVAIMTYGAVGTRRFDGHSCSISCRISSDTYSDRSRRRLDASAGERDPPACEVIVSGANRVLKL
jgi:hypothetical protein